MASLSFDYDDRLLIAKLGASHAFGVQRGDVGSSRQDVSLTP
jgi:hypothetical protein